MTLFERYDRLRDKDSERAWREVFFEIGHSMGFEKTLLAIVPRPGMKLDQAFLCSNYDQRWRADYDKQGLAYIDPTVSHCLTQNVPLIWSPNIFRTTAQKQMYEEACGYGLRSGVTLPIHGAKGELGILCFVNDSKPGKQFQRDLAFKLPGISLLRDIAFDTVLPFVVSDPGSKPTPVLTHREIECLKWVAIGKTSWEISGILKCTAATVNFHMTNIRRKFEVGSRHEAVIMALRHGLIDLP